MSKGKIWFALAVLFAINLMNFYDRLIIGAVGESIRKDWNLSDSDLGYLGTAFILLYAAVGVPLGRWADRCESLAHSHDRRHRLEHSHRPVGHGPATSGRWSCCG